MPSSAMIFLLIPLSLGRRTNRNLHMPLASQLLHGTRNDSCGSTHLLMLLVESSNFRHAGDICPLPLVTPPLPCPLQSTVISCNTVCTPTIYKELWTPTVSAKVNEFKAAYSPAVQMLIVYILLLQRK